ncbi:MAG: ultraviolet light resistance protein [Pseudomonas sp.]|nr:ultraviolet light resistance protein [Pseudomonas sp.]
MESETTIQATETVGEQLERLRSALESADLPAVDIELSGRTFFEFTLNGMTVGWGGFEMLLNRCQPGEYTDDLFATSQPTEATKVMAVLDEISGRWGRGTLRAASVPRNPH